ncbi:hypothetical protein DQ356_05840 [Chryseobacterium lacus]|uniref:Uncharacterized protein n=1 Tax=Chryseobacterium lacus TaxID=2058346 RepID=A0A368MXN6_9FLAO|nr:hypothetical protein DQ356_05840 [Chryseobacterium lacus]
MKKYMKFPFKKKISFPFFLTNLLRNIFSLKKKRVSKLGEFSQKPRQEEELPENASPVCFAEGSEIREEYKV